LKSKKTKEEKRIIRKLRALAQRCLCNSDLWMDLFNLMEKQKYRCPLTGDVLRFDKNSSVDHILSVKDFPELKYDIDNLRWVTLDVNRAKGIMNDKEFYEFISKIYHHLTNEKQNLEVSKED